MSDYLRIRNLEKFQHYRDRRPPWVKLYQTLLDEVWFARLHDASKAHCILLILLASRLDNRIPNDAGYVQRSIQATDPVDLELLLSVGWLEVCGAEKPASKRASKSASKSASKKGGEKERRRVSPNGGASRANEATPDAPREAWASAVALSVVPSFKNWPADYGKAWEAARRGTAPFGRIGSALQRLIERDGPAKHYPAWLRFVASDKATYGPEHFANNLIEFTTSPRDREQIRHEGEAFNEQDWLVQSFELANRDRAKIGSPLVRWEDVHPDLPCPPHLKAAHAA